MSYDTTRDSEQLRVLDPAIDDFIERYNTSSGPAGGTRQTVFLFPGGMACKLKRARTPYVDGVSTPQTFAYDTAWLEPEMLVWPADVPDLEMTRVAPGKYRDKDNRIIVADGAVGYLGCTPYAGFTLWCQLNGLDYLVYGWDWRRRIEHSGRFFVKKFLPYFQARVKNECNNADPLANFSLIGHSAGGMVVNWILRMNDADVANNMRLAITVATPFYGYTSQVHRWFQGQPPFNGLFNVYRKRIIKTLCSFPACYAWMFLDEQTYNDNQAALAADPKYPLLHYPSTDKDTGVIADPYNPLTKGALSRYPAPSATRFDDTELGHAKKLVQYLASDLGPLASKFINIRGDTTATDTAGSTTWDWVPPTDPCPIDDGANVPGDGTQPAWSARHVGAGAVITVDGSDVEHTFTMNSPTTLNALAGVLGI